MEPPSTKMPVLFQSEKKLKQATLPFKFNNSKTDSPLQKRQRLNNSCKAQLDDDLKIIEEIKVNEKKSSPTRELSQMEVEEVICEVVPDLVHEVPNKENETDGVEEEKLNSSDVILLENRAECSIDENIYKSVDEIKNVDGGDSLKSCKRKLENAEKIKEMKPPKRAKLIYNVDRISINKGADASNVNSVKTNSGNSGKIDKEGQNVCNVSSLHTTTEASNSKSDCQISYCQNKWETNSLEGVLNETTEQATFMEELNKSSSHLSYKENDSEVNENCTVGNTSVDSDSSVELLTPAKSNEKPSEENYSSHSLKSGNCSPSGTSIGKQLTPKQAERKAEIAKKREEIQQKKEKKRLEKNRVKQEKEEEKARLKQEKLEEMKKKKEEKEKRRLEEIELKNEEKRKKEKERRKKEEEKLEEKRKKEEQKLEDKRKKEEMLKKKEEEQEMQKKKKTKEAEAFSSFFKKCDSKTVFLRDDDESANKVVFMPFAVRADMRLAPVNRNPMDNERRSKFEELLITQSTEIIYLQELSSGVVVPKKSGNTWPLEEKYEEVIISDDEGLDLKEEVAAGPQMKFSDRRPKLLQFHENRRPPYWGTWRKKSKNVRPKAPFGKDKIFDYEVDSDDEWEEEEPGESLHGSDDEKESEDEYEVDNDFFVPHGYLSDDENPEEEIISPETQKAKLKLLGEQFDLERNEKTKLLKPILLGCIWFKSDSDEATSANPSVVTFLNKRKAVPWTDKIPITIIQDENVDPAEAMLSDSGTPTSNKEAIFPESAIPDLITLIYGSTSSRKNLAKTFLMQWNKKQEDSIGENEGTVGMLSQARIAKKIRELAKWEEFPEDGPFNGRLCWYVKKEVREKFGLSDLSILQKGDDISDVKDSDSYKKISPSLITKFTKVLTEDERRNQITKARKSLSLSKTLNESTTNTPKQVTPLKCIKKLKEFWAKPSLTSKYTPAVSADPDEVIIISPDDVAEKTVESVNEEGKNPEGDDVEDCEITEIKEEGTNSASTVNVARAESSKEEMYTGTSADCSNSSGCFSKCDETKNSNVCVNQGKALSKPVVKKRVPILFSAPRGCEIIKPKVESEKPVAMNETKKCDNCKVDEGETGK